MQVTCPACSTRYTTDDAKVRGKTVRMRCRACDTVWLVSGPSVDAAYEDAAPRSVRQEAQTEKRAAVVKRGAEREKRDLFAPSPDVDAGVVRQTLRPAPVGPYGGASAHGGGIGARSEDSVLFTLDSLRGGATNDASPASRRIGTPLPITSAISTSSSSSSSPQDDEGIIDLLALSQRPPTPVAFGVPSEPPTGFARDMSQGPFGPVGATPPPPARPRLVAAVGSLVALVIAVVSAFALFGGDIPHRATRAATNLAPRAAAAGARAQERELARLEAEKKAAEQEAAAAAKEERTATRAGAKPVRWTARGATRGAPRGGATASRPPAVKSSIPADRCGCKGDFNCILRCSAKGK